MARPALRGAAVIGRGPALRGARVTGRGRDGAGGDQHCVSSGATGFPLGGLGGLGDPDEQTAQLLGASPARSARRRLGDGAALPHLGEAGLARCRFRCRCRCRCR
ncbi:hypothetical protein ADL34_19345 [Streptomyces sp. NRRL WC-3605]|nr:hypothetical protein ADL34_19345 [Streptomyces sp. NRRL WC-3605]KUL73874.1 hypothetical protein ADL33_19320 [Streptomyces sp. NRRL WC-3604]